MFQSLLVKWITSCSVSWMYRLRGLGSAVRSLFVARVAPLSRNQKWFDPGCEGRHIRSLCNTHKQILHAKD
jgi:hypothetical protein